MILYDRLNRKNISLNGIEVPILLGQYLILLSDEYIINNERDIVSSFLVPCDNLKVFFAKDKKSITKMFDKNIILEKNNLLLNNTFLDISSKIESDKISFNNISPVLINFDDKLSIDDNDKFIEEHLFHIEEICKNPAYKLGKESTKVNISRAKRIPIKAISYLASHTEDWSRRTITGIQPKKIISESFTYDLEIYENKITIKTIDDLIKKYLKRLNEAEDIKKYMNQIEDILESNNYKNNWYKKTNRTLEMIGQSVRQSTEKNNDEVSGQLNENQNKYKNLRDFIGKILSKLLNLKGTEVYKANQYTFLPMGDIQRTNLLDNHQHYRHIRGFRNTIGKEPKLKYEEIARENTKLVNSFIDFSWLLIARSLILIGFVVNQKDKNKVIFESDKYNFLITIKKDNFQNIEVACEEQLPIKFIPILHNRINISKKVKNEYYLILDDGINEIETNVIKISPNQINSEERIAKKLYEMIFVELMNNYYLPFDAYQLVSQHELSSIKEWIIQEKELFLISDSNKKVVITKYFSNKDEQDFENYKKSQSLKPNKKVRDQQNHAMQHVKSVLMESRKHFAIYSKCLSCNQSINANYDYGISFSCQNKDCGVSYGVKIVKGEKKYFYNVPNFKKILKSNPIIEDAIGYEHVDI